MPKKISYRAAGALLLATSISALMSSPAAAYDGSGPDYLAYDGGLTRVGPDGGDLGPSIGFGFGASAIGTSINGISQVDVRALHANSSEIPPDTMGAVGATQFMETSNGAYAVYNKTTGAQQLLIGDGAFWAAAGQPASNGPGGFSNGDSRVLYDAKSQKWIVESFGADLSTIQIAVSTTSDALGPWRSTTFTGFAGGIADYPTLAIDNKAVYIGTNDFGGPGNTFQGTTLNVIARDDLFGSGAPVATSLNQFFTPYATETAATDRGYAIQGVNQVGGGSDNGKILAVGAINFGAVAYSVTNPGTAIAAETAVKLVDTTPYSGNSAALQPDGTRNIDTSDDRYSGAVFEYKGNIYAVHTITPVGGAHTVLQVSVINAATSAVVQETTIGDATHDFYQGSLTINKSGQVVLGYNESGLDMNVSIYARTFNPKSDGSGALVATGTPILIYVSPIGDYHNGSVQFAPAVGRQRWGDYSQVTIDPTNDQSFWVIGEYALGYLPSPTTSFSRWGTYIQEINLSAVPEPSSWALMLTGFGLIGGAMRRRNRALAA